MAKYYMETYRKPTGLLQDGYSDRIIISILRGYTILNLRSDADDEEDELPTPLYRLTAGICGSSEGIPCAKNAGNLLYLGIFTIITLTTLPFRDYRRCCWPSR
jgi:hypothetical protein